MATMSNMTGIAPDLAALNLNLARAYLAAHDPKMAQRTWQAVSGLKFGSRGRIRTFVGV
ncbi:MAG: hypothetical protein ACREFF_12900 [Candidatus Udaeobacter sp.]